LAPHWVEHGRDASWTELDGRGLVPRDPTLARALDIEHPDVKDPALRKELEADPWQKRLLTLVEVRRCWGVQGLFWALLLNEFENARRFTLCHRCGRPLPLTRKQCGRKDDPGCYRAQAAHRQRESRDHHKRAPDTGI
jgi:hypothetical protein